VDILLKEVTVLETVGIPTKITEVKGIKFGVVTLIRLIRINTRLQTVVMKANANSSGIENFNTPWALHNNKTRPNKHTKLQKLLRSKWLRQTTPSKWVF